MKKRLHIENKLEIIDLYRSGVPVLTISTETDIPRSTIYSWIKAYEEDASNTGHTISRKEHNALIRKVARLEDMVKILKSVDCMVSSPLQEKLNALESLHDQFSVHVLCDALEVSRGTYYNHIFRNKRDNTIQAKKRKQLSILIQDIFDESDQRFGAGKIRAVLVEQGHSVSEKTVAELMREMNLYSISKTSKREYTKWRRGENKNVLQQNFQTEKPNQVWVGDVTVFKFNEKYYYTCVIIDLFSRKIVAYKTSKTNSTQLVTKTFKEAYALRNPDRGLIFHSDRGAQYISFAFQRLLRDLDVTQSFSRSGRPHDNAVAESFFSYMKKEELYRRKFASEPEYLKGIDDYISFYNEKRPHTSLQYKTPDKMETIAFAKLN